MNPLELYAAYGAPALLVVLGYALLWWTRLSPVFLKRLPRFGRGHPRSFAPTTRTH